MRIGRRGLLGLGANATIALVVASCSQIVPRPTEPAPTASPPEFEPWLQEGRGILSDVRQSLLTFDDFQAFRVSTAQDSGNRLAAELMWDPPTGAAWDEATHVARGLTGRAEQLFQAITSAKLRQTLWREQRTIADASHELLDLANALGAYRDRVDTLPPGDGSAALASLDKTWAQWEAVSPRWGLSRAQSIGCAMSMS